MFYFEKKQNENMEMKTQEYSQWNFYLIELVEIIILISIAHYWLWYLKWSHGWHFVNNHFEQAEMDQRQFLD